MVRTKESLKGRKKTAGGKDKTYEKQHRKTGTGPGAKVHRVGKESREDRNDGISIRDERNDRNDEGSEHRIDRNETRNDKKTRSYRVRQPLSEIPARMVQSKKYSSKNDLNALNLEPVRTKTDQAHHFLGFPRWDGSLLDPWRHSETSSSNPWEGSPNNPGREGWEGSPNILPNPNEQSALLGQLCWDGSSYEQSKSIPSDLPSNGGQDWQGQLLQHQGACLQQDWQGQLLPQQVLALLDWDPSHSNLELLGENPPSPSLSIGADIHPASSSIGENRPDTLQNHHDTLQHQSIQDQLGEMLSRMQLQEGCVVHVNAIDHGGASQGSLGSPNQGEQQQHCSRVVQAGTQQGVHQFSGEQFSGREGEQQQETSLECDGQSYLVGDQRDAQPIPFVSNAWQLQDATFLLQPCTGNSALDTQPHQGTRSGTQQHSSSRSMEARPPSSPSGGQQHCYPSGTQQSSSPIGGQRLSFQKQSCPSSDRMESIMYAQAPKRQQQSHSSKCARDGPCASHRGRDREGRGEHATAGVTTVNNTTFIERQIQTRIGQENRDHNRSEQNRAEQTSRISKEAPNLPDAHRQPDDFPNERRYRTHLDRKDFEQGHDYYEGNHGIFQRNNDCKRGNHRRFDRNNDRPNETSWKNGRKEGNYQNFHGNKNRIEGNYRGFDRSNDRDDRKCRHFQRKKQNLRSNGGNEGNYREFDRNNENLRNNDRYAGNYQQSDRNNGDLRNNDRDEGNYSNVDRNNERSNGENAHNDRKQRGKGKSEVKVFCNSGYRNDRHYASDKGDDLKDPHYKKGEWPRAGFENTAEWPTNELENKVSGKHEKDDPIEKEQQRPDAKGHLAEKRQHEKRKRERNAHKSQEETTKYRHYGPKENIAFSDLVDVTEKQHDNSRYPLSAILESFRCALSDSRSQSASFPTQMGMVSHPTDASHSLTDGNVRTNVDASPHETDNGVNASIHGLPQSISGLPLRRLSPMDLLQIETNRSKQSDVPNKKGSNLGKVQGRGIGDHGYRTILGNPTMTSEEVLASLNSIRENLPSPSAPVKRKKPLKIQESSAPMIEAIMDMKKHYTSEKLLVMFGLATHGENEMIQPRFPLDLPDVERMDDYDHVMGPDGSTNMMTNGSMSMINELQQKTYDNVNQMQNTYVNQSGVLDMQNTHNMCQSGSYINQNLGYMNQNNLNHLNQTGDYSMDQDNPNTAYINQNTLNQLSRNIDYPMQHRMDQMNQNIGYIDQNNLNQLNLNGGYNMDQNNSNTSVEGHTNVLGSYNSLEGACSSLEAPPSMGTNMNMGTNVRVGLGVDADDKVQTVTSQNPINDAANTFNNAMNAPNNAVSNVPSNTADPALANNTPGMVNSVPVPVAGIAPSNNLATNNLGTNNSGTSFEPSNTSVPVGATTVMGPYFYSLNNNLLDFNPLNNNPPINPATKNNPLTNPATQNHELGNAPSSNSLINLLNTIKPSNSMMESLNSLMEGSHNFIGGASTNSQTVSQNTGTTIGTSTGNNTGTNMGTNNNALSLIVNNPSVLPLLTNLGNAIMGNTLANSTVANSNPAANPYQNLGSQLLHPGTLKPISNPGVASQMSNLNNATGMSDYTIDRNAMCNNKMASFGNLTGLGGNQQQGNILLGNLLAQQQDHTLLHNPQQGQQ